MIICLKNYDYPYIVVLDVEHDQGRLIQFAGILLRNIDDDLYQVERSLNFYVKREHLNDFTVRYTHINVSFLEAYGITEEEARAQFEEFLKDIPRDELVFVSHGIKQDSMVLRESGIYIDNSEHICTFNLAKQLLKREKRIKLSDIVMDAGLCTALEHNAYTDAVETIFALSFLLMQEEN